MTLKKRGKFYHARFYHQGREITWSTKQTDERRARQKAKNYRQSLIDGRHEAIASVRNKGIETIQDHIGIYQREHRVRQRSSVQAIACLKLICAEVGLPLSTPVTGFTKAHVKKFLDNRVTAAGDSGPDKLASAKRSANSAWRNARSIWSRRLIHDDVYNQLPPALCALPVRAPKSPRYRLTEHVYDVLDKAKEVFEQVKDTEPFAFAFFLLATQSGCRSNEIAEVRVDWLEDDGISIPDATTTFEAKSEESAAFVPVPKDVIALLRSIAGETFVFDVPNKDKLKRRVSALLRQAGSTGRTPIHAIRKFVGAQVATEQGLFAAQHFLRHKSPTVTNEVYADIDRKRQARVSLYRGGAEEPEITVTEAA